MLTRTNYTEWAILMRVQLQGALLLEAIEPGTGDTRQERQALGAILRSVPPEMVPVLSAKDNAQTAWNAIKKMRVGIDRVRESRRQRLRKDFENLSFKSDEGIEDFALRISGVVSELQSLGDGITELTAVQKFLCVVPSRYAQMACSIETLLDLEDMTVEELSGRLSAADGRGNTEPAAGGQLLLTEEWRARQQKRAPDAGGSGGGGGGGGDNRHGKDRGRGRDERRPPDRKSVM